MGGLANRIFAITAAISFCKDHGIYLKVYWFRDRGMGAKFVDLFDISQKLDNVEIIDAKWFHCLYDRPRKKNLWLPKIYQKISFDKVLYECEEEDAVMKCLSYDSVYLVQWCQFYKHNIDLSTIYPCDNIKRIVDQRMFKNGDVIGIHIRRTDNMLSIQNSPDELFVRLMREEINRNKDVQFYLASDSDEVKEKILREFSDKIIIYNNLLDRSTKMGVIDAYIELLLLSKCSKIYGSFGSTYSILASFLNGIQLYIVK
ncbi:hypothetical protein HMPREF1077_01406 [Parabacteroides johnsonii CL02T12C29]|uniref:Uncharacterized protein n=2 Tax=Parabacteroides johnsonii TaxID=387661 RepID=K6A644_9BACT|nr:hypothetical protein HMPREF1077_01406 [Parabacteroides johnsonii CL02T12C29]